MASKAFPVKGAAYSFGAGLFARSNNQLKANPTLASGDFKISKDGGAFANLATLPSVEPASGTRITIALSSGEMGADEVVITAVDGAGDEWHDAMWVLHTVGNDYDDLSVLDEADLAGIAAEVDTEALIEGLLTVDWAGISGEAAYSMMNAFRFLRNRWDVVDGVLTVYKEDGTTPAWSRTVTTDVDAPPVTGVGEPE